MKKKGLSFPAIILIVVFFIVLAITSFFIAPIIKEKFDGRDSPSSLINDSQAQAGTTNSGGDTNTDMNSNEETPTQEESNEKAEELIDLQEQIPNCTEADWVYNISPVDCPLIGNQTKTWNKIGNCENGIEHDSSEIISCNPDIPTCTNFTYSDWGDCISSGTQSRSVLSSSPNGCVGGNPTIFQSCTYIAPFCSTGIKAISNTCNWALKDNVRVNLYDYSYVDSVTNYQQWFNYESTEGSENYNCWNRMSDEAIASNKRVAWAILTGAHAPSWLYDYTDKFDYDGGASTTYLPWTGTPGDRELNTVVLSKFENTINTLSSHFSSEVNASRISHIHITGWPFSNGLEIQMPLNTADWDRLNYDAEAEALYIEFGKRIVDIFINAFPDVSLTISFADNFGPTKSYSESDAIIEYALEQAEAKGITMIPMGHWIEHAGIIDNGNHPLVMRMNNYGTNNPIAFEGPIDSTTSTSSIEDQLNFIKNMNTSWVQFWHSDVINDDFQDIFLEYASETEGYCS